MEGVRQAGKQQQKQQRDTKTERGPLLPQWPTRRRDLRLGTCHVTSRVWWRERTKSVKGGKNKTILILLAMHDFNSYEFHLPFCPHERTAFKEDNNFAFAFEAWLLSSAPHRAFVSLFVCNSSCLVSRSQSPPLKRETLRLRRLPSTPFALAHCSHQHLFCHSTRKWRHGPFGYWNTMLITIGSTVAHSSSSSLQSQPVKN